MYDISNVFLSLSLRCFAAIIIIAYSNQKKLDALDRFNT